MRLDFWPRWRLSRLVSELHGASDILHHLLRELYLYLHRGSHAHLELDVICMAIDEIQVHVTNQTLLK